MVTESPSVMLSLCSFVFCAQNQNYHYTIFLSCIQFYTHSVVCKKYIADITTLDVVPEDESGLNNDRLSKSFASFCWLRVATVLQMFLKFLHTDFFAIGMYSVCRSEFAEAFLDVFAKMPVEVIE